MLGVTTIVLWGDDRLRDRLSQSLDAVLIPDEQDIGGTQREDTYRHHAGNIVDISLEFRRFHDVEITDIQNRVAVVAREIRPQCGRATQADKFARDQASRHGYDFNRYRKRA